MFTQSAEAQEFTASFEKMFNEEAERIGKKTGFIQRQRKLTAKAFALGLLFAWMQNPESSVEELTNAVVLAGSPMKTSSLEERFTPAAAEFFRCLLQFAVQHKLDSSASRSFGLLSAFSAVYINDCSSVSLPKELSSLWQGCGGTCGENAALKASVRYELLSGRLDGPILSEGREHDTKTSLYREPVKENSLTLNDLGFFQCVPSTLADRIVVPPLEKRRKMGRVAQPKTLAGSLRSVRKSFGRSDKTSEFTGLWVVGARTQFGKSIRSSVWLCDTLFIRIHREYRRFYRDGA